MRVLLVDDHPIVRASLRQLLTVEPGTEIGEAGDGRAALALLREQPPDVVVLDLNLPGIGGLDLISRLKAADPVVRVLVLSMHDDPARVGRALRAGAAGYIGKHAPPEEILTAVRRVAAGLTYVEREIAQSLVFANFAATGDPLADLSIRDLEILRLLADGRSLPQIAEIVGIGYKTAANTLSRLKVKLGAASTAGLIRIAIESRLSERDAAL